MATPLGGECDGDEKDGRRPDVGESAIKLLKTLGALVGKRHVSLSESQKSVMTELLSHISDKVKGSKQR